jgi:predicted transcriptional regulator
MGIWETDRIARETVSALAQSEKRIQILKTIREEPATTTELANRCSVDRSWIGNAISPFETWGGIETEGERYELTVAGGFLLDKYSDAKDELGDETLQYLAGTKNRLDILRSLQNGPVQREKLYEDKDISRKTINRILRNSEEKGYVSRNGSPELTGDGKRTVGEYDDREDTFKSIIENAPALQDFDTECSSLPIEALSNSQTRIELSTPAHPFHPKREVRKLAETDFEQVRTFRSSFESDYANAFAPAVLAGKKFTTIRPKQTLENSPVDSDNAARIVAGCPLWANSSATDT